MNKEYKEYFFFFFFFIDYSCDASHECDILPNRFRRRHSNIPKRGWYGYGLSLTISSITIY